MQEQRVHISADAQYMLVGIVFLFLCPLLSIPVIVYGIYHRKKGACFLLALLLGIFAFISAPSEDIYRHYCTYEYFSVRPLSAITIMDVSLNSILPYLYWVMSRIGISFSYIRLVELVLGFSLLCKVFYYMIDHSEKNYSKNGVFARFVILFAFFDFMYTTMGVKFGFALCTYIYALHLLLNMEKKTASFFVFLFTCIWHLSFIFTIPFVFLIYKVNPKKSTAIWGSLILTIVTPILLMLAGYVLFGRRFEFYFSKKADNVTSYAAMTTAGLIMYILPKIPVTSFAILLLKNYCRESKWCRIALGWLVLSVALISNAVTFYRFWWAFMALGIFFILDLERLYTVFSRRVIFSLIVCGMLFTMFNLANYHKEIIYSQYYRAIYPTPLILDSDYEKKWVFSHIKSDGDFR